MTDTAVSAGSPQTSPQKRNFSTILISVVILTTLIGAFLAGQFAPFKLQLGPSTNGGLVTSSEKDSRKSKLDELNQQTQTEISNIHRFTPIKMDSDTSVFAFPFFPEKAYYTVTLPPADVEIKEIVDAQEHSSITAVLGATSVSTSPNGKVVAYITKDNLLGLMSADRTSQVAFPKSFTTNLISWWSPDSTKFIAYSMGSIAMLDEGMGEVRPELTLDKERLPAGPYIVDVERGEFFRLPDFSIESYQGHNGILGWVGSEEILVNPGSGATNYQNLHLFNVEDYVYKRQNLRPEDLSIFSMQISISANGRRWAHDVWPSNGPYKETTVMRLTDFPDFGMGDVESNIGTKIGAQWPLISPNGNQVAYMDQPIQNDQIFTYLSDGVNPSRQLSKGLPIKWTDNTHLIVAENDPVYSSNYGSHLKTLRLIDVATGESQVLFAKD